MVEEVFISETVKYDLNDDKKNKDFYKRFYKPLTDNASDSKKQIEEFRGFLDRVDISDFDATDELDHFNMQNRN